MMLVRVHALPMLTTPAALADQTVVVVDVLRATTTMLCALQAGAVAIRPCLEVEEARALFASLAEAAVLGGERGGQRIAGFALGNSPLEYTPETVGGRTVVMTTTNGTRALQTCRQAQRVVIGAFVNLSQVAEAIRAAPRITVLCAGTDQHVTREDVLFAGALVSRLQQSNASGELNDEAELAVAAWHQLTGSTPEQPTAWQPRLLAALRASRGGRNLVALGLDADIDRASQVDTVPLLGELAAHPWRVIRAAALTLAGAPTCDTPSPGE